MLKSINIFTKGSILPPILEMEGELIEQENEALKLAEEKTLEAKLTGEKLIENTMKELHIIEEEERKKILEGVDAKAEEIKVAEEHELRELGKNIERNRKSVLDSLMKNIIPNWDSRYLD